MEQFYLPPSSGLLFTLRWTSQIDFNDIHSCADFAKQYDFTHITSSPKFPQANGAAERAVHTVKTLLTKSDDPHMAMLAYRSTPLEDDYSPATFNGKTTPYSSTDYDSAHEAKTP